MPFCGPTVSTVGLVLSIWGITQLALTGIFFHFRSVALVEDLAGSHDDQYLTSQELFNDLEARTFENYAVTPCVPAVHCQSLGPIERSWDPH